MKDTTYASFNDIKEYTPLSDNMSEDVVVPFIGMAETFHLKPVLGSNLNDSLLEMIDNDTLSGVSYTLVNEYIIPASVWYSYYESIISIWLRPSTKGLTKAFSDNSSAADKKDVEMFRQDAWDKATEYKNRLIDFLNDSDDFPEYGKCSAKKSNSTGIFLG